MPLCRRCVRGELTHLEDCARPAAFVACLYCLNFCLSYLSRSGSSSHKLCLLDYTQEVTWSHAWELPGTRCRHPGLLTRPQAAHRSDNQSRARGPGPPSSSRQRSAGEDASSSSTATSWGRTLSEKLRLRNGKSSTLQTSRRAGPKPPSVGPVIIDTGQAKSGESDDSEAESRPPNLASVWALIVLSLAYLHHSTTGCATGHCGWPSALKHSSSSEVGPTEAYHASLRLQVCSASHVATDWS